MNVPDLEMLSSKSNNHDETNNIIRTNNNNESELYKNFKNYKCERKRIFKSLSEALKKPVFFFVQKKTLKQFF